MNFSKVAKKREMMRKVHTGKINCSLVMLPLLHSFLVYHAGVSGDPSGNAIVLKTFKLR